MDKQVRLLREYGWEDRYVSAIEGGNSRLDELQAAALRVKLTRLREDNDRRRALARHYRDCLRHPDVSLPVESDGCVEVYHQFVVRTPNRDALQAHLKRSGIGSLVHYPVPVHRQPAYALPAYAPMPLSNTETLARSVLSLPMFPQLDPRDVERVAGAVNAWESGTQS
jgi:dTDP-4-amino-4,6-dideoxygalactose transaminase